MFLYVCAGACLGVGGGGGGGVRTHVCVHACDCVCVCVCVCAGADAAPTGTKGVLSDVSVCLRACANPIASTLMFLRSCCCGSNALCFLRCGTTSHMSRCYSSCVCVSLPHTCRGGFRFCVCVALPHTCRNGFLLVFVWHCLTHVAMVSFLCLCGTASHMSRWFPSCVCVHAGC